MVLIPQHSGIPLHLSQSHRMRFCLYIQGLIQMIAVQGKFSLLLKCSPYRPACLTSIQTVLRIFVKN